MKTILAYLLIPLALLSALPQGVAAASAPAVVGQTVTISVTAKGTQPFRYQWYKDGKDVVGATSSTLVLRNVTVADSGRYSAAVSNAAGGTQSDDAIISVGLVPATEAKVEISVSGGSSP